MERAASVAVAAVQAAVEAQTATVVELAVVVARV